MAKADLAEVMAGDDGVEVEGDSVTVTLSGVRFMFAEVTLGARKFEAELLVTTPTHPDPFDSHISASSPSQIDSVRRNLEHFYGTEIDWKRLILKACMKAKDAFVNAPRLVNVDEVVLDEGGLRYALDRLIIADQLNIIYGLSEAAKSLCVQSMIMASTSGSPWLNRDSLPMRWVWLDYENPTVTPFARRRQRLLFGGQDCAPDSIHWVAGRGIPIPEMTKVLRKELLRVGAQGLVVDSLGFGCGGDAIKQEIATATTNAIQNLGVTVIGIGQTNKDENENYPFGSVFWHYAPHGMNWFLKRHSEEGSNELVIGWYNRKASDGGRQKQFGVRLQFDGQDGPITIEPVELTKTALSHTATLRERIWAALDFGKRLSASELAKELDAKEDSVRKQADRMLSDRSLTPSFKDGVKSYARMSKYADEDFR